MLSSSRWMTLGGAVLGLGALLLVSWLIYGIQSKTSFWYWPGILGVTLTAIGLVVLIVGFVLPDAENEDASPTQRQYGGDKSINLQAGRDIKLGQHGSDD